MKDPETHSIFFQVMTRKCGSDKWEFLSTVYPTYLYSTCVRRHWTLLWSKSIFTITNRESAERDALFNAVFQARTHYANKQQAKVVRFEREPNGCYRGKVVWINGHFLDTVRATARHTNGAH